MVSHIYLSNQVANRDVWLLPIFKAEGKIYKGGNKRKDARLKTKSLVTLGKQSSRSTSIPDSELNEIASLSKVVSLIKIEDEVELLDECRSEEESMKTSVDSEKNERSDSSQKADNQSSVISERLNSNASSYVPIESGCPYIQGSSSQIQRSSSAFSLNEGQESAEDLQIVVKANSYEREKSPFQWCLAKDQPLHPYEKEVPTDLTSRKATANSLSSSKRANGRDPIANEKEVASDEKSSKHKSVRRSFVGSIKNVFKRKSTATPLSMLAAGPIPEKETEELEIKLVLNSDTDIGENSLPCIVTIAAPSDSSVISPYRSQSSEESLGISNTTTHTGADFVSPLVTNDSSDTNYPCESVGTNVSPVSFASSQYSTQGKAYKEEMYMKIAKLKRKVKLAPQQSMYLSCILFFSVYDDPYPIFENSRNDNSCRDINKDSSAHVFDPLRWTVFDYMNYFENLSEAELPSIAVLSTTSFTSSHIEDDPTSPINQAGNLSGPPLLADLLRKKSKNEEKLKLSSQQKSSMYRSSIQSMLRHEINRSRTLSPLSSVTKDGINDDSSNIQSSKQSLPIVLQIKFKLKGTKNVLRNKLYYSVQCYNNPLSLRNRQDKSRIAACEWLSNVSSEVLLQTSTFAQNDSVEEGLLPKYLSIKVKVKRGIDEDFYIQIKGLEELESQKSPSNTSRIEKLSSDTKIISPIKSPLKSENSISPMLDPSSFHYMIVEFKDTLKSLVRDSDIYFSTVAYLKNIQLDSIELPFITEVSMAALDKIMTPAPKQALIAFVLQFLQENMGAPLQENPIENSQAFILAFDKLSKDHITLHYHYRLLFEKFFCFPSDQ